MNENIVFCSEKVKTYVEKLFDAFGNATSIFFVALPIGLFLLAYNRLISYYKDNGSHYKEIKDYLDQEAHKPFKKAAIPFIRSIDESLTEHLLSTIDDEPLISSHAFIKEFQLKKFNELKKWDITLLEETIDFQEAVQKIVKLKKDHGTFEGYISKSRVSLFLVAVSSLLSILFGGLFIYFTKVNLNEKMSFLFLVAWVIFITMSLAFVLVYGYYCLKIDSLKTKK